jgi:hypothetical protein
MPANTIPDTSAYLYLGLVVIFTITTLFVVGMAVRYYNLWRELEIAEQAVNERR